MMQERKGFAPVLVLTFLTFIGVSLFLLISLNKKPTETSVPVKNTEIPVSSNNLAYREFNLDVKIPDSPTFGNNLPKEVVSSLIKYLNSFSPVKFSSLEASQLWWISDDGWNIIDKSALATHEVRGPQDQYLCPTASNCFDTPAIKWLNNIVTTVFKKNGFEENILNSSKPEDEKNLNGKYDDILAFQKGETKCITKIVPEIGSPYQFGIICADQFKKAYAEQLPFLMALDNSNSSYRRATVGIEIKSGDWVYLNVQYRRTGVYAVMKKINGNWVRIYGGQDFMLCDEVNKLGVPTEIYGKCYDCPVNSGLNCTLDNLK